MRHRAPRLMGATVALLVVVNFSAFGAMRPSFSLNEAVWEADQIVVVRVSEAFEILEVWHGDLSPGTKLEIPTIRILDPADYAKRVEKAARFTPGDVESGGMYVSATWDKQGNMTGEHTLYLLEGLKAVLFLVDEDSGSEKEAVIATLVSEPERRFTGFPVCFSLQSERLPGMVAWIYEGEGFSLQQIINPGAPITCRMRDLWRGQQENGRLGYVDAARLRDLVGQFLDEKRAFDAAAAIENPEERVAAVRPLLRSSARDAAGDVIEAYTRDFVARTTAENDQASAEAALLAFVQSDRFVSIRDATEGFRKGGPAVVPALLHLLQDAELLSLHECVLRVIQEADPFRVGPALIEELAKENAYWRTMAPQLARGWLRQGRVTAATERERARERHLHAQRAQALLYTLTEICNAARLSDRKARAHAWADETAVKHGHGSPPADLAAWRDLWEKDKNAQASEEYTALLGPNLDSTLSDCREVWLLVPVGDEGAGSPNRIILQYCRELVAQIRDAASIDPLRTAPVVVRLFSKPDVTTDEYRIAAAVLEDRRIRLREEVADEPLLVSLVPEDQVEPSLIQTLGGTPRLWAYAGTRAYKVECTSPPQAVVITDAPGEPIAGAELCATAELAEGEPSVRITLGRRQTDERGRTVPLMWLGDPRIRWQTLVRHADYGTALLTDNHTGLLAKDSPLRERALRGRVLDEAGNPIEGTVVKLDSLSTRNEGIIAFGNASVVSEPDGSFCVYPPRRQVGRNPSYEKQPIPLGVWCEYEVRPPAGSEFAFLKGEGRNDEETTIVLPRGRLHSFVFEDEEGPVTDEERLRSIRVTGKPREGGHRIKYFVGSPDWQVKGAYLAEATYRASILRGVDLHFEPLEVTEESPEELIFRLPEQGPRIEGTVVDAHTKAPIGDALVLDSSFVMAEHVQPTAEEWAALEATPSGGIMQEGRGEASYRFRDASVVSRTDSGGRFSLQLRPGLQVGYVTALARGYQTVTHYLYPTSPDEKGVARKAFELLPAASAVSDASLAEEIE